MKKVTIGIGIIVVLVVYLIATDFGLVKSLIGYHMPHVTVPKVGLGERVDFLTMPGFVATVFARDLDQPRVMIFDAKGNMLVSETQTGSVVRLVDSDGDGVVDASYTVLSDRNKPHGLEFYTDEHDVTYLYVAEETVVSRFIYDAERGEVDISSEENIADLLEGGRHVTRSLLFGPNFRSTPIVEGGAGGAISEATLSPEKLYISVGSSCDACVEDSWKYAAVLESDPAGTYTANFSKGLRNAIFMALHPVTGQIWATEMGRDGLGDDLPPDEINILLPDANYGWPECYGKNVLDTVFHPDDGHAHIRAHCQEPIERPSYIDIAAHSAPMGLAFISNRAWPTELRFDLLVAYHGSWNRTEPTGYSVVRFDLDETGNVLGGPYPFIDGWLSDDADEILGRPVDLKFGPDGALYISDDAGGIIYRVVPDPGATS